MYKIILAFCLLLAAVGASAQTAPVPTPAKQINNSFSNVTKEVLEMAKDFPEAKYNYRPSKEVRSFGEVIVHISGGFRFADKRGRGENVKWDEFDPKDYKTKAQIVALMEKQLVAANATLATWTDDQFNASVNPWVSVIEHTAEHYGQLVVYYRLNGLVPPSSRPKPKK